MFIVAGSEYGAWAAGIPRIKLALALSDTALGMAILGLACGAMAGMLLTGMYAGRLGLYRVSLWCGLAAAVALVLPGLAVGLAPLIASAFILGVCAGSADVAMNAHATVVECRWGAPVMSSFHAGFSLGGLLGATCAGLLIAHGFGRAQCFGLVSLVLAGLLAAASVIDPAWRGERGTPAHRAGPGLVLPGRAMLGLGLLAFLGLMLEGVVVDWSGVYMTTVVGATTAAAAAGFAAFSVTMAVGRALGDHVVRKIGRHRVLALGGAAALLGFAVTLGLAGRISSIAGYALAGAGLANLLPVVFSAGGRNNPGSPSAGVAAVASFGYFGFLCGPPLIGIAADAVGLRIALSGVVMLAAVGALWGWRNARL